MWTPGEQLAQHTLCQAVQFRAPALALILTPCSVFSLPSHSTIELIRGV